MVKQVLRAAGMALGLWGGLMAGAGTASAQVTEAPRAGYRFEYAPVSPNAALRYWAVWSSIPKELSDAAIAIEWKDTQGVTELEKMPESFRAYLKTFENSPAPIEGLLQATRIPRCDFELELDQGPTVLLPHLGRFRQAARLLHADARRLLIAGDVNGAAERIAAILRSAAHLQSDRTLISQLVEQAIVALAVEELRTLAPRLSEAHKTELRAMLLRYDPRDPFRYRQTLAVERDVMSTWLRSSTAEQIGVMMKEFEYTDRAREAGEKYRSLTPEQHAEQVRKYVQVYNEMIEAWDAGDQARLARIADGLKSGSERSGVLASYLAADIAGMFKRLDKAQQTVREGLALLGASPAKDEPSAKRE